MSQALELMARPAGFEPTTPWFVARLVCQVHHLIKQLRVRRSLQMQHSAGPRWTEWGKTGARPPCAQRVSCAAQRQDSTSVSAWKRTEQFAGFDSSRVTPPAAPIQRLAEASEFQETGVYPATFMRLCGRRRSPPAKAECDSPGNVGEVS